MCAQQSYDQLLAASTENWRQWWQKRRVTVNGGDAHDRALDYALYHLRIMTPAHDERSSIAAKGLTGEGHKGHVFWDTEAFLLPFHLFSDPTVARSLPRYRWHNLPGARRRKHDATAGRARYFRGSARAAAKKRRRNLPPLTFAPGCGKSGLGAGEHHPVADIAWAVIHHWQTTGDKVSLLCEGICYFWRRQSSGLAAR